MSKTLQILSLLLCILTIVQADTYKWHAEKYQVDHYPELFTYLNIGLEQINLSPYYRVTEIFNHDSRQDDEQKTIHRFVFSI
jgi:hypothetical protein